MSRLDFCEYELVDDCYDWKNDNCDECNIFKAYCEGARRAKNSIVRCKDCKNNYNTCINHGINQPMCDFTNRVLKETDFCSRGERRTDESPNDDFCSYGERAEPTEYKMPGHDEVMEALEKLTLDPIWQGTSKSEGHCFDCVHNEVCRYYDHIVGGCDFKETVEDLGARV